MQLPENRKSGVRQSEILLEIPCADIDQVMLFGNVQVTTQAIQELLQHGIELAIFTFSGKLLGQITPPKTKNIILRIDQFKRFQDPQFCIDLAKQFVVRKIDAMLSVLKAHQSNYPDAFRSDELSQLVNLAKQASNADNSNSLLGFEGTATSQYFKLFGTMLKHPWEFNGRNRRPPKDPVNAVLSFGYVLVGAEIQSLLDGVGFDPYLGFYHRLRYGRPSLALDLLEEFRHNLVDRLALNLFNLGILKEEDFDRLSNSGVYLGTSGKKKFFVHYERMMGTYQSEIDSIDKKKGFRMIFQQRIAELAKQIYFEPSTISRTEMTEEDFDI